eukprot:3081082-Rhodomonas_salina.3
MACLELIGWGCSGVPQIEKHGPLHILDYFHEFKKGRISGDLDLSNFDLSHIPLEAVFVDRPLKWTRFGVDRYIRVFTEDLSKRCTSQAPQTLSPVQPRSEKDA